MLQRYNYLLICTRNCFVYHAVFVSSCLVNAAVLAKSSTIHRLLWILWGCWRTLWLVLCSASGDRLNEYEQEGRNWNAMHQPIAYPIGIVVNFAKYENKPTLSRKQSCCITNYRSGLLNGHQQCQYHRCPTNARLPAWFVRMIIRWYTRINVPQQRGRKCIE